MVFSGTTALYVGSTQYSKAYIGGTQVWPIGTGYSSEYLTFEITSGGTISFWHDNYGMDVYAIIDYNKNNTGWVSICSSGNPSISVVAGDIVQFRGNNQAVGNIPSNFSSAYFCDGGSEGWRNQFQTINAHFNIYGNIMSMQYGDNFIGQTDFISSGKTYSFAWLFSYTQVNDASNLVLPVKSYTDCFACYWAMFWDCPFLKTAPTIEIGAYSNSSSIFDNMFSSCSSLNYVKALGDFGTDNTNDWLSSVAGYGTFVKKTGVSWPSGASGIPNGWTVVEE